MTVAYGHTDWRINQSYCSELLYIFRMLTKLLNMIENTINAACLANIGALNVLIFY